MNANPFAWLEPPIDETANRLAAATDAGVPLDEIFLALADDSDNRHVRRVSRALATRLEAGDDLATAVGASEAILPRPFRRALAATTDPSQTAPLLRGMAAHEAARHRLKRRIRAAILYPVIVLALLSLVIFGLCLTVIPEFREMFIDWDLELPIVTEAIFKFADLAPWIAGGALSLVVLAWVLGRIPGANRIVHWLRTGIPFAGQLWIWNAQHDFASMMAELVGARLPLHDALRCTSESLHDRNVARAARIVARKCEAGVALSQGLAESLHFDRALSGLTAWGEANDALPAALRQAAEHYEQEIDQHATFLRRVAPPILYVSVLSVVFLFVFAMFVPLTYMINGLWW